MISRRFIVRWGTGRWVNPCLGPSTRKCDTATWAFLKVHIPHLLSLRELSDMAREIRGLCEMGYYLNLISNIRAS